jgi:hypothetical protein
MTRVIAAAAALLAVAILAASAGAAPSAKRNILVFAGNDNPHVVAAVHRVSCSVSRRGGKRKFHAAGRDGGWKLEVEANHFTGYHDYDIEYGIRETNFILRPPGKGSSFFSNFFFPGEQPPPFAGKLTFPHHGKKMGLGFPAAFTSGAGNDAVGLAGIATCR